MKFFGIRYFNIKDEQYSVIDKEPSKIFLEAFMNNDQVEYYKKYYTSRVFYQGENDKYVAGCLFKSKDTHLISLEEDDFDEEDVLNWEKLYFIIDTEEQVFACQLKQSIAKPASIRNMLEKLTERYYKNSGYNLKLEFLRDKESFWSLVKGTEEIYEISFSLNAPNLFGLSKEATGFLREVKDTFNIDSLNLGFKNSNGTLSYDEDEIEPLRDYADSGGGKWTVKILEDGKRKRHNSDKYFDSAEVELKEDEKDSITESIKEAKDKLQQAVKLLKDASAN